MQAYKNENIILIIGLTLLMGCNFKGCDSNFKGTYLTQENMLRGGWWRYSTANIKTYLNDSLLESKEYIEPADKKASVFSLEINNELLVKKDDKENFSDSAGNWKINFIDSILEINFKDYHGIHSIHGKIVSLGSNEFSVAETNFYRQYC